MRLCDSRIVGVKPLGVVRVDYGAPVLDVIESVRSRLIIVDPVVIESIGQVSSAWRVFYPWEKKNVALELITFDKKVHPEDAAEKIKLSRRQPAGLSEFAAMIHAFVVTGLPPVVACVGERFYRCHQPPGGNPESHCDYPCFLTEGDDGLLTTHLLTTHHTNVSSPDPSLFVLDDGTHFLAVAA